MRIKVVLMLLAGMQWATAGADPVATDVNPPGSAAGTPAGANAAANSPAPNPSVHVSVLTPEQLIELLDKTVDWYRTLGTQQQSAPRASALMIFYANKQAADQVVNLAIEIARASAELISSEASAEQSADSTVSQSFEQQRSRLAQLRAATQAEMDADRQKLATAPGNVRRDLEAKLPELQGELSMLDAQINMLNTMSEFVHQNNVKAANANALKAHIDAIAASVPTVTVNASAPTITPAAASGSSASTAMPATVALQKEGTRSGIWDLLSEVLRLRAKIKAIDAVDARTAALATLFENINKAPLEQLKAVSAQSEALAAQADNATSTTLSNLRKQFDTLAWVFKQTSAILLPLSKESVLLQQYRHNLDNWRQFTRREYKDALRALGVRLGVLVGMLAVVFILAEVWRRAVLHYAREPRHRYQLLLIRTIVMWTTAVIIVALSFVTELSTFATFAGLLSAGVAVAMQSVLVSIVGYFFLIGKYGIRVGDRIQIGTVVGEVVDLGLVRMHLMELNSQGALGATGRGVAFANSIVFQASGGLFKQISGVNFAWHEATLPLPAGADAALLKEKLLVAVNDVVKEYHDEIVRQTREIQKTTSSSAAAATTASPQVQLRFSATGVEALVRYPVQLQHAAQIDEQVSEAMLKAIRD